MKKRNNIHVLIDIFAPKDGLETYQNMQEKYARKIFIKTGYCLVERARISIYGKSESLKTIRRNWPVNTK